MDNTDYSCSVIGGGLAGLSLAIQLAQQGQSVVLFEKEQYPFHRVCGEYISMESWPFLQSLGLPLADMNLPRINRLHISAPNGNMLQHQLQPGGFGISRFAIDNLLADIALQQGVTILQEKVSDIQFAENAFYIATPQGKYITRLCFGAFGKRSNMDLKLGRAFVQKPKVAINNYIGIKYHIQIPFPTDLIELHNFKNGYCGISKVEGNRYCLCYLTTAKNLRSHGNSIKEMEEKVLMRNPHLKKIFTAATFLYTEPLAISQISFAPKSPVENHLLMAGDAAGLITPLCGNGMSMALQASKEAAILAVQYFNHKITRAELETNYAKQWKQLFSIRLHAGRVFQHLFGQPTITNLAIHILKRRPKLMDYLVNITHGKSF